MRVLVGCEESQAVTIEFRRLGHEAYSCDILPCSGGHPEWHIQDDVLGQLYDNWEMMIAFPPCTYLSNSGVRWLYDKDGSPNIDRWVYMYEAAAFFEKLRTAPIAKIALENPVQHGHARKIIPIYDQTIQPYQFGHGETKRTCLWLKGLLPLQPTNKVEGREQKVWKMPPGPDRARLRSKTYPGIAKAMAEQWSHV